MLTLSLVVGTLLGELALGRLSTSGLAALSAGINKLVGARRSIVGADTLVGRTAVVVSAFTSSADGWPVGRVQLGVETWRASLESRSMSVPVVGAPVKSLSCAA